MDSPTRYETIGDVVPPDAFGGRGTRDQRVTIKAWTRGVPVEESAMRQLQDAASLPFVGPHVAVMPDVHLGFGATVGSVIPTESALVPAAVGVDIGCFVGETRIPLLDGSQSTLSELAGRTEPFWVYASDDLLRVVPGRARCVRTRANAELMRIVVSGGDEIVCTPDHQFRLYDGTYREAKDLRPFDSLLPLYRRWESRDGYEHASTGKGRSEATHTLVWEHLNGPLPHGHVVHHENHKWHDNRPENLTKITIEAHSTHHRSVGRSFENSSPCFQEARRAGIARRASDPFARAKMAAVGSDNIVRYMRERPDDFAQAVSGNGKRGAPTLVAFNRTPRSCSECAYVAANPSALLWHQRRAHGRVDKRTSASSGNHKVIRTERLTRREDVYCLQVERFHNFALSAGVFVHNCGMVAARTPLTSVSLGDNAQRLFDALSKAIPHGRTDNGGPNDRGAWSEVPGDVAFAWHFLGERFAADVGLDRAAERAPRQLGTLGTGNHFVEVCLDEADRVWLMLHSGSRGVGNAIGSHYIAAAKRRCEAEGIALPNADLAWLPEGTPEFDAYVRAVGWAQTYARENRKVMLLRGLAELERVAPDLDWSAKDVAVNSHHNYVNREHHFGRELWITRKGAVSAQAGELGIIPGSMGARSFIVRGKGNPDSFCSCSHGAGRVMSRGAAKRAITPAMHAADTAGVVCRQDAEVLDESPRAYKNIDAVLEAQADLVEVVHTLKQVVCVKG